MDLEEKARVLIEENYTQEFTSKIVEIYMAHNRTSKGGNHLPLDVAVELAAVELGIITVE
tara:strand:+ start:171 stop:350 length:180 start_codon:yes stop_codon:yes gene_type:complete